MQHLEVRKAVHRLRSRAKCSRCKMLLNERWDSMLPPLPLHPAQTPPSQIAGKPPMQETPIPPAAPVKVKCRRRTRAMRRTKLADRTARKLTYSSDSSLLSAATALECSEGGRHAETAGTAVLNEGVESSAASQMQQSSSAAPQAQQPSQSPVDPECPIQNEQAAKQCVGGSAQGQCAS